MKEASRCGIRCRFDLLTDVGVAEQSGDLSIVEDSRGNIQAGHVLIFATMEHNF